MAIARLDVFLTEFPVCTFYFIYFRARYRPEMNVQFISKKPRRIRESVLILYSFV